MLRHCLIHDVEYQKRCFMCDQEVEVSNKPPFDDQDAGMSSLGDDWPQDTLPDDVEPEEFELRDCNLDEAEED